MTTIEHKTIDGIKIYTGTTESSRERYMRNIRYFDSLTSERVFDKAHPSTLTAQGQMSNISFNESELITKLTPPKNGIMVIGCNYGEIFHESYKKPVVDKKSGRGRKPKPKIKTKRRSQGNGKYFSSQITFVIKHPVSGVHYKIKLFRNGVFQVPGVKDPSMSDLVEPINILKNYLVENFKKDVQVVNFMAVMRNYKAKLSNESLRVDLVYLEDIINFYKNYKLFLPFIQWHLFPLFGKCRENAMLFIGKTNLLNIAESSYNTDKCFCLTLKFYRSMPNDEEKKTTVKLLKKGKINFDGGNSEFEMLELYYWLQYVYARFSKEILVDTNLISNVYNATEMAKVSINDAIYSDDEDEKPTKKKRTAKKIVPIEILP